jgi:enoyl-CoA hydratase/carnithine racemase
VAYEHISVDIEAGVALVRIRREHKRNALSEAECRQVEGRKRPAQPDR